MSHRPRRGLAGVRNVTAEGVRKVTAARENRLERASLVTPALVSRIARSCWYCRRSALSSASQCGQKQLGKPSSASAIRSRP